MTSSQESGIEIVAPGRRRTEYGATTVCRYAFLKLHYFGFLAEHYPALLPATAARFAECVDPERRYTDALEARARRARARYEFVERPFRTPEPAAPAQLRLAI